MTKEESLRHILKVIREHHVELNNMYGRDPRRSKTILLCDTGLQYTREFLPGQLEWLDEVLKHD